MSHQQHVPSTPAATSSSRIGPRTAMSVLRGAVGAGTWLSPAASWRVFGLGHDGPDPSAAIIGRLFGVRDLALAVAVRHPDPAVRRAALQVGVAADGADVVASLLGLRAGAPRATLLGVGAGAALFVAMGLAALREEAPGG